MRPWLLALLAARSRTLKTQTFTANTTWVAPFATTQLESAAGKGVAGTPASSSTSTHYYVDTYAYYVYYRRDGGNDTGDLNFVSRGGETTATAPLPSPYIQGPFSTPNDPVYYQFYIQYEYFRGSETVTDTEPATTGASTTGFGKTFPGGHGGAASTTTFTNVAVTPGTAYPVVVPAGGTLTITWYQ